LSEPDIDEHVLGREGITPELRHAVERFESEVEDLQLHIRGVVSLTPGSRFASGLSVARYKLPASQIDFSVDLRVLKEMRICISSPKPIGGTP
jgi:hypothetical protein